VVNSILPKRDEMAHFCDFGAGPISTQGYGLHSLCQSTLDVGRLHN
jgi:hypothetical protein